MTGRSGISVQNPGCGRGGGPGVDLVQNLLRKAQEEGVSGGEAPAARSGSLTAGAHARRGGQPERARAWGKGGGGGCARSSLCFGTHANSGYMWRSTQTNLPSAYYS
jgi:hypothetical protein